MRIFLSSFAVAVFIVLTLLVYRHRLKDPRLILRTASVIILILALAGFKPTVFFSRTRPRHVVMLVDESRSMALGGKDTAARTAIAKLAGHVQQYFAFSESSIAVARNDLGRFDGRFTDIGRALDRVVQIEPSAIVLISDGNHNYGKDPLAPGLTASVPVYAVGVGKSIGRNAALVSVDAPPFAFYGDKVEIRLRVKSSGNDPLRGQVATLDQGRVQAVGRFEFSGPGQKDLTTIITPRSVGVNRFRFRLTTEGPDDWAPDNEIVCSIVVLKSKMRVLYGAASPSSNVSIARRSLVGDRRIASTVIVQFAPGEHYRIDPERITKSVLPALEDFDVAVMDDVALPNWPGEETAFDFVRQGGGLLILAGDNFGTWDGFLERACGVRVKPARVKAPVWPVAERNLTILASGLERAPFDGAPSIDFDTARFTVLARSREGSPLLGSAVVGQGRIMVLLGYPLWQWGMRAAGQHTENPAGQLLLDAVYEVSPLRRRRLELRAAKTVFGRYEPVDFQAIMVDRDLRPITGSLVMIEVPGEGRLDTVPMFEQAPGRYQSRYIPVRAGAGQARAFSLTGPVIESSTALPFEVLETGIEQRDVGLNRELMEGLARATGGAYSSADRLPEISFPTARRVRRKAVSIDFASPYLLLLACAMLITEWFLRKRRGDV